MKTVVCIFVLTSILNFGILSGASPDVGGIKEVYDDHGGKTLHVGDITVQKSSQRDVQYDAERDRRTDVGRRELEVESSHGLHHAGKGHERLSADDHSRLQEASKSHTDIRAGKDVRYENDHQRQADEEERRRIAIARDYQFLRHAGFSDLESHERMAEAISTNEAKRRRANEQGRTKLSAGSDVSFTHHKEQQSDDEEKRRAQLARQSSKDVSTAEGILGSSSAHLSQEEYLRRLRKLNETKDLKAGDTRLIHRKQQGQAQQSHIDDRDAMQSLLYSGNAGAVDHVGSAHSHREGAEDVRGNKEQIELSAGNKVRLQETIKGGSYDKSGRDDRTVLESTAVADSGNQRLKYYQNLDKSKSEIQDSKHGQSRDQTIGLIKN